VSFLLKNEIYCEVLVAEKFLSQKKHGNSA